ncbi:MAG: HD domain-containing protein [Spirochaetia bacterium]|nr:HD domain-containing protein [Spirochaetia bacterium]
MPYRKSIKLHNEVNCLNIKVVYDYMLSKAPEQAGHLFDNLPEPYSTVESPEKVLTDENNWVTSALIVKIFENARSLLNDPHAPYHIGKDSIEQREFGYIQKFFLVTFGGPTGLLKRINHINSQFNHTKIMEIIYSSPSRAVVRLHWKENRVLSKDICSFNKGIYSAIPTIWKLLPAQVEEPFCYFNGDPYCQFNIQFHAKSWRPYHLLSIFQTRKAQLLSALEQIESDKLALKKQYDEVNRLNHELYDKVEKLRAVNLASNMLVSQSNSEEILKATMKSMVEVLDFDRAIIMLVDKDERYLEFKYAIGDSPEAIELHLRGYRIPIDRKENIMARVFQEAKPMYIQDPITTGLHPTNRILSNFDVSSFIIAPLRTGDKVIGIVGADRLKSKGKVSPRDLDELSIFTNTIAETLHKAQLKEEIESGYVNTVGALVQAIEEKDAYTRGHSERVAELSMRIGRVLGLEQHRLEYLRIGCLLHDVGKIGISESIVRKPKNLTASEYNIIKQHPLKGAEIVKPISFLKDHMYIIRNHHEWYDGTGYPDGLEGDNIPLEAQIVSVADAYDAITSTRPYRKGLTPQEALHRITLLSGSQFAPPVVKAFKQVYSHLFQEGGSIQSEIPKTKVKTRIVD